MTTDRTIPMTTKRTPTTITTTTIPPLRLSVAAHDSSTVREALLQLHARYPDVHPVEFDASQSMVTFPTHHDQSSAEEQQPSPRTVEAFNTFLNDLLMPGAIHNVSTTSPRNTSPVDECHGGRSRSPSFCKSTEELERWLDQEEAKRRRVETEMPVLHERIRHAIDIIEQALERYG